MLSKKRERSEEPDSFAQCPFKIQTYKLGCMNARKNSKKKQQRRTMNDKRMAAGNGDNRVLQPSPFEPKGKFKKCETMDVQYNVEPLKRWQQMKRYNSFALNGNKYPCEGFIYVANHSSLNHQVTDADPSRGLTKQASRSDDDWVAYILEIRANDEHHVYARIYWMYWPQDLGSCTMNGVKLEGCQTFHGKTRELIASNHMDIINVMSVAGEVTVQQLAGGENEFPKDLEEARQVEEAVQTEEETDTQGQNQQDDAENPAPVLYWRQALDIFSQELSALDPICSCRKPENPEERQVMCTTCGLWMHDTCITQAVLASTYERLGYDKPYVDELKEEHWSLTPGETGTSSSTHPSIAVLPSGENDHVNGISRWTDEYAFGTSAGGSVDDGSASEQARTATPTLRSLGDGTSGKKIAKIAVRKGTKAQKKRSTGRPPWADLFEARLTADETEDDEENFTWVEITDLRTNVLDGAKIWRQRYFCLGCKSMVE